MDKRDPLSKIILKKPIKLIKKINLASLNVQKSHFSYKITFYHFKFFLFNRRKKEIISISVGGNK